MVVHEAAYEVHAFGVAAGEKPAALFARHGVFSSFFCVGRFGGYPMVILLRWGYVGNVW